MPNEMKLRPPYAGPLQADGLIDLLRRISPKKIDAKFIVDNNLATSSNAFRVLDLVKWFGISNLNGEINEEIVSKLKLVGKERDSFIQELIKNSYKDLFESVDVKEAKKEDVINYFISQGLGSAPSKAASSLFSHLCQKYEIEISKELEKKEYQKNQKKSKERKIKKVLKEKNNKVITAKEGILIKSKVSMVLDPKTKEEADEILKIKLPKIFEVLKLDLPSQEK